MPAYGSKFVSGSSRKATVAEELTPPGDHPVASTSPITRGKMFAQKTITPSFLPLGSHSIYVDSVASDSRSVLLAKR